MEKRTFLAIALSLLVLFGYTALVEKLSPQSSSKSKILQIVENKKDTTSLPKSQEMKPPASPLAAERIETIEGAEIQGYFSNLGGSLQRIIMKKYLHELPIKNILNIQGYSLDNFRAEGKQNGVVYSANKNDIEVTKAYSLSNKDNGILIQISIKNNSTTSFTAPFEFAIFDVVPPPDTMMHEATRSLLEYSVASSSGILRKDNAYQFSAKEAKSKSESVYWVGFRDRYFCAVFKPLFETASYEINPDGNSKVTIWVKPKEVSIAPGKSISFEWIGYAGLQDTKLLNQQDPSFGQIVSFSNLGFLNAIATGIHHLLYFSHKFIPNWGVCIILVSVLIYLLLYPLTFKSMLSMRKMQALQPKISKLRAQHGQNPQKLNKEIMELYKANKVNPFSGCLPLVLQMPIFIGLYQVLWRSIYFNGADFLWIKDLSQPDRFAKLPFSLPFLGSDFNLLPLLMMIIMFFQQKLSSQNMIIVDDMQRTQQKMMGVIFPVFLGIIFYNFSSGLCLYFTTFYLLSTLMQWKMSKIPQVM